MAQVEPPRANRPNPVSAAPELPADGARPRPWEMVRHPVSTVRFMVALGRDPRVSGVRKLLYIGPLLILLIALLLPEGIIAAGVALLVPLIGPLVNLPADAVLDWVVFGLAAYALLGILPSSIVSEHHVRLFHSGRVTRA